MRVKTPKHELEISVYHDYIQTEDVEVRKEKFEEMCRNGCRNYDNKYCCPPFSPGFGEYVKEPYLLVILFRLELNQLSEHKEYLRLRIGNAVIKPRIEKLMRELEKTTGTKFLSTGACRLCRPCQKKLWKPCRNPDKMRYSLEALGVNCNELSKKVFGIPLKWYENGKAPEYTCVICALPVKERTANFKFIKIQSNKYAAKKSSEKNKREKNAGNNC